MSKEKSGDYFSMSDEEHAPSQKQPSRGQQHNLRSQFLEKAKQFMDDTALGETKGLLNQLLGKAEESQALEPETEAVQEDWEDDWEEDEEEEFDYSDPESIRVGYAKPGSKPPPKRKTLDEARDESFDMKLEGLSGLLNRFGAERVEEEKPEPKNTAQIDMALFSGQMQKIYALMAEQSGESAQTEWLRPEILSLLRISNSPELIMEFVIAGVFAATPENFMAQSDVDYIIRLLHQIGIDLPAETVMEAISQTFMFAERVHRLYAKLLEAPPQLSAEQVARQKENLAKLFIHQVAHFYETDHKSVIRTLAERWTASCKILAEALSEIERIHQQLSLFKERKMASATIFQKSIRAEERALAQWELLRKIAWDISALKKVTLLLEEHEALQKLQIFPIQYLLPEAAILAWDVVPSWQDIQTIFAVFQAHKIQPSQHKQTELQAQSQPDLSPLNQKKIVTRAKNGEVRALKEITMYKHMRITQIRNDLSRPKGEKQGPVAVPEA